MQTIVNSRWVAAHRSTHHIVMDHYREEFCDGGPRAMTFGEALKSLVGIDYEKKKVEKWARILESIVDESIPTDHNQYLHACRLIDEYIRTKQIEPLLRLYTLQTNFYTVLTQDKEKTKSLFTPIMYHLPTISSRAFEGHSYRGLTMGEQDFEAYRWAFGNSKERHLGTNTFWSTSIDQQVAKIFSGEDQKPVKGQLRVLMEFHFTYPCSTAIALFKQPRISHFEDEEEVLILPGTVFRVTKIEEANDSLLHKVYLERLDVREEINEMIDFVVDNRIDDFMNNLCDS
jgi:hypothetical protein